MRKILTTIAIVLCAISVKSQDFKIDETTKLITYTEVVELPNVSKADFYLRANTWFSRAFKSAKNVIDFQDKETGKIIAVGPDVKVLKVGDTIGFLLWGINSTEIEGKKVYSIAEDGKFILFKINE